MADVTIDLSGVYQRLDTVNRNVNVAINNIGVVSNEVNSVRRDVSVAQKRIQALTAFVERMKKEQDMQFALNLANSEIIRIRQELERDYGTYQRVRDGMRDVLNAEINEASISKISDELRMSAKEYWLAPCLVAVAAWISKDETIAKQAIEEALDRDCEKTSLLMALVCRRAGKTKKEETSQSPSQKWLQLYFECQSSKNISRSALIFVDAYENGLFGETDNAINQIFENKWIKELSKDNNFCQAQKNQWKGFFRSQVKVSTAQNYPTLCKYADKNEFGKYVEYADRLNVSGVIETYFMNLINQKVTPEQIEAKKNKLDQHLLMLVRDFDRHEKTLREEEEKFQTIKDFGGDKARAEKVIRFRNAQREVMEKPVAVVDYLNESIQSAIFAKDDVAVEKEEDNDAALKKDAATIENIKNKATKHDKSEGRIALRFTKQFVQESYNEFMTEKKGACPKKMRTTVEGVSYSVEYADDEQKFATQVKEKLNKERQDKLAGVKASKGSGLALIAIGIVLLVLIGVVVKNFVIGIIAGAVVAGIGIYMIMSANKKADAQRLAINQEYDNRIAKSAPIIKAIVAEWLRAVAFIAEYEMNEHQFNINLMFEQSAKEVSKNG